MKLSRRRKRKNKSRYRDRWQTFSNVQESVATKEEINAIALMVFGGVNVSSKDL